MSCCDVNINLGCFPSCGTLTLPYAATESGSYTFTLKHGANYKSVAVSGAIGVNLSIDMSNFNETGSTEITIKNPSGSPFSTVVNDVEYSCFILKTFILYGSTSTTSNDVVCCSSILLEVNGVATRTILASEWASLGVTVPSIEVFYNDGGYIQIPVQGVFNAMPTPTQVVITIPGVPVDTWYIKLS